MKKYMTENEILDLWHENSEKIAFWGVSEKAIDLVKRILVYKQEIKPVDVLEYVYKKYRFVHIDVDAYKSGKDIFDFIWPLVVKGEVVVFDDYGFSTMRGITRLCNEVKKKIVDCICICNLNGHAIFRKI